MTPKPLRFYLYQIIAGVDNYYIVDGSGNVITTTDKTIAEVEYDPEQWKLLEDGYERSDSMYGIFTRLTSEYTFYKDARTILNFHVLSKGYDAALRMRVEELMQDSSGFYYVEFADSDIDFPETDIDHISNQIALTDKGLAQDIMQNLNTPLEITIDGGFQTYFAGTRQLSKYPYRYSELAGLGRFPAGLGNGEYINLLMVSLPPEGLKPVIIVKDMEYYQMGEFFSSRFYSADAYLRYGIKNSDTNTVNLYINYKNVKMSFGAEDVLFGAAYPLTVQLEIALIITLTDNTARLTIPLYSGTPTAITSGDPLVSVTIPDYTGNIGDFYQGEGAYIVHTLTQTTASTLPTGLMAVIRPDDTVNNDIFFQVESNTAPTFVNGLPQRTMYKKAIEQIADGKYGSSPSASPLLNDAALVLNDNSPYYTLYCNALHLKGVGDAIFKTTLGAIIKDLQSRYASGLKVKDNVATFDSLDKFFDDSVTIAEIDILTGWSLKPTNEMGNRLIFGNAYDETDVLNGVDDYNTKSTFVSAARFQKDKPLDFTSSFITSVQSIEKQRVQEYGKDTTGNKINDQIFVFSAYPFAGPGDLFLNYPNQLAGSVSGVYFPDWAYNVDLSPRRNALRLSPLINSYCFPSVTPIEFKSSERNSSLVSNFASSTPVYENSAIVPDSNALYLPFILKGKSVKPLNLNQMMKDNPYGAVEGKCQKDDGTLIPFRGFIKSVKVRPVARNDYEWEFYLAPSTDITKFI